ncbi:unnamed protein product [Toxocara canis]|uniref:Transposase n=1 Tax=Toxocara canis TaxID=6265 RepID=A0A183UPI6_TOXCA|nr:unnamed protein product [Toxocara canis]
MWMKPLHEMPKLRGPTVEQAVIAPVATNKQMIVKPPFAPDQHARAHALKMCCCRIEALRTAGGSMFR